MKQTQKTNTMKTAIDTQKEKAQMLIEYANGGSFTIKFNNPTSISGRGVKACLLYTSPSPRDRS